MYVSWNHLRRLRNVGMHPEAKGGMQAIPLAN